MFQSENLYTKLHTIHLEYQFWMFMIRINQINSFWKITFVPKSTFSLWKIPFVFCGNHHSPTFPCHFWIIQSSGCNFLIRRNAFDPNQKILAYFQSLHSLSSIKRRHSQYWPTLVFLLLFEYRPFIKGFLSSPSENLHSSGKWKIHCATWNTAQIQRHQWQK